MTPGLKLLSGIGRFLFFLGLLPIAFANELYSTIDVPYVAVNVNIPYGVQGSVEELLILTHMPDISVGDHLEFHHHTATTPQVHQCLEHFWKPRWTCENLQK